MPAKERPILIATRGSALALAQANAVLAQCRAAFPRLQFELKIIKTTGDKLQTASPAKANQDLAKGLFTKELEVALIKGQADLAVHSLKDLPTELPGGLILGAVGKRADARDVLIYRDAEFLRREQAIGKTAEGDWVPSRAELRGFKAGLILKDLPKAATVATGSTRRAAQLLALRPDLRVVGIRGNVETRLQKIADQAELDATILAAAGLERLNFMIQKDGRLTGDAVPDGLLAVMLEPETMLPAVGQGAVGIETRAEDGRIAAVCERLNHFNTRQCVIAERAFLAAMGGGCQSPIAAYAEIIGSALRLRAVSFRDERNVRRGEAKRPVKEAVELGQQVAEELK